MPDEIIMADQEGQGQEPSPMPSENQPAEVKENELPDGVSERTKAEFEKLKQHNKELAEELKRVKTPQPSVLDSLRPTQPVIPQEMTENLNKQQVDDIVTGLVDENGYIDEALLKNRLLDANKQAQTAIEEAKQAKMEAQQARAEVSQFNHTQQTVKTHSDFPEVDPNSDVFNADLYELVRNEMVGQMINGHKEDFYGATRKWVEKLSLRQKVEKQENVVAKEQINAGGSSKNDNRITHDSLVRGTMEGNADAIYQRLKNGGY